MGGFIQPEDAERIVACINACQGIPTWQLEAGVIDIALLYYHRGIHQPMPDPPGEGTP